MLFANDYNDNRVHIDDAHSNKEYYCPYCGAPLITKKGEIRQHHFAHKQTHVCKDSWERNNSYDTSLWHNEWQSIFPKVNQEIKLSLGDTKHRADILIDRTVIEFQHSIMPVKAFDDRNNFYFNLGYKVVWLFDLSELYRNDQLIYKNANNGLVFNWKNPKRAFNNYDIKSGCIDLFFQLNNECIVRVTDVSVFGFECFYTTNIMSKDDFLVYVGLVNGICLPPCRDDIENNHKYQLFKEKYKITLNKQQERALQAVEGSTLLLAVPGSGKTTVLVARLGYMILHKNIAPENILAITYNKDAAVEMKERFSLIFGMNVGKRIKFQTINSLSLEVYTNYCHERNKTQRKHIEKEEKHQLLSKIYKNISGEYATENDIIELASAITYIKNMQFATEQILELDEHYPHLSDIYKSYQEELKKNKKMDYDDQMVFAHWILNNDFEYAKKWQNRYKYICVDEAQDTSKIQHSIINIISQNNNIFMVGDEDQSIYGFRAAYPKALLNFRYDYLNPYILRMERNYRSTPQIVDAAQKFISQNKGRYEKNMVAERDNGEQVKLENVKSREEQYARLLEIAQKTNRETAFLYRDNESAVVLVDIFLRNNITFTLSKPKMNFFGNRIVKDIVAYLSLATNNRDIKSFEQICNKGIVFLPKAQKDYAIRNCDYRHISIYDALEGQKKFVKKACRDSVDVFYETMKNVSQSKSSDAISMLLDAGYDKYIKEQHLDMGKIEILMMLSKHEPNITDFLRRLQELEKMISQGFSNSTEKRIVLSTIHSSKGKEYDSVYMVDVYDGRFPSSRPDMFCSSKDNADTEQEERRMFYVGITRAKNTLYLFNILNKQSSFVDELFPKQKIVGLKNEEDQRKNFFEDLEQNHLENLFMCEVEKHKQECEESIKRKQENKKEIAEKEYIKRYNEVKDRFVQQETQIRDSDGNRWVKCEVCGEIKETSEFSTYGGSGSVNSGLCNKCCNNRNNR